MTLSLNIIGAGKVGKTLAHAWLKQRAIQILGICNEHLASSKKTVEWLNQGQAYESIEELPEADLTLITTVDDSLENCFRKLALNHKLKPQQIVFHCSGFKSSQIFKTVWQNLCEQQFIPSEQPPPFCASVHPLMSFNDPLEGFNSLHETFATFEGDPEAKTILKPLFEKLEMNVFDINSEQKSLYHIAACLASNYLITLHYLSQKLMTSELASTASSKKLISQLMRQTLHNIEKKTNTEDALTGPIQRGDWQLVNKHIEALNHTKYADIYKILGKHTLEITKLDETTKLKLLDLLQ